MHSIKVANLDIYIDHKTPLLKNVNFELKENDILLLLGESGAGKTILLKALVDLVDIDRGEILFNDIGHKDFIKNNKNKIGFLFQNSALFDDFTAGDNLIFILKDFLNISYDEAKKMTLEYFDYLNLDKNIFDMSILNLSGGTKRRISLIRAFIHKPKFIFLDDIFLGLDIKNVNLILDFLTWFIKNNKSIMIICCHDFFMFKDFNPKILVLKDNQSSFFNNFNDFYKFYKI